MKEYIDQCQEFAVHYTDVIMGAIASQITSLTIVYSTVYSGADQRNITAPRHWPLCGEFTGDRWIPVTRKMCPFDDVIMGQMFHVASEYGKLITQVCRK